MNWFKIKNKTKEDKQKCIFAHKYIKLRIVMIHSHTSKYTCNKLIKLLLLIINRHQGPKSKTDFRSRAEQHKHLLNTIKLKKRNFSTKNE